MCSKLCNNFHSEMDDKPESERGHWNRGEDMRVRPRWDDQRSSYMCRDGILVGPSYEVSFKGQGE